MEIMLASVLEQDLDRLTAAACVRLRASVPHVQDDAPAGDLEPALRTSFEVFLRAWSEARPFEDAELASITMWLDRSDSGLTRAALLQAHRVAVDVVRDHIERHVNDLGRRLAAEPAEAMALLKELGLARSLERQLTAAVETVASARDQAQTAQGRRLERHLVAALLDMPTDPATARGLLRELGLPVAGPWTVAVLPASRQTSQVRATLAGSGLAGAVVDRREGVVVLAAELPAVLAEAVAGEEAAGIGTRAERLTDARASAEAAASALEVSVARRCGPVRADGAELDLLLLGAVTPAELVERTLAPLAGIDETRRTWMIETLEAYLDAGSSATAAARALSLHRESVRYRVTQLRELFGSDLDDPDRRLALHLAVKALRHNLPPVTVDRDAAAAS